MASLPAWAALTLAACSVAMAAAASPWDPGQEEEEEEEEGEDGELSADALNVSMVFYDFRTVRVSWEPRPGNLTFLYRYHDESGPGPPRECPRYVLGAGGLRSGCELGGRGELLHVCLRNGTHRLARLSWFVGDHLQPAPPQNVSVTPRGGGGGGGEDGDAVTVACEAPRGGARPGLLLYEVQYRSRFDAQWQSREGASCRLDVAGLDGGKCYAFRVRARPRPSHHGPRARPSEWSAVIRWGRKSRPGAPCSEAEEEEEEGGDEGPPPGLLLPCVAGSGAAVALLLAWLRRARRVKELLVPCVPDPRGSFPGLFDKHRGDFQAWIAHTQNGAAAIPEGFPEEAAAAEEESEGEAAALVVQEAGSASEPAAAVTAGRGGGASPRDPGAGCESHVTL